MFSFNIKHNPQFSFGKVELSVGMNEILIDPDSYLDLRFHLGRHIRCDWGEADYLLASTNDEIIEKKQALPVKSVWIDNYTGERFFLITNGDRTVTNIVLESEQEEMQSWLDKLVPQSASF